MTVVIKTKDDNLIWLDAVTSFTEDRNGSLTQHPVQSGYSITDHFIKGNLRFSMSAVVSDYDFNFGRDAFSRFLDGQNFNENEVLEPVTIDGNAPSPLQRLIPEAISALIDAKQPTVVVDEQFRKPVSESVREELIRLYEAGEAVSLVQLDNGIVLNRPASNLVITSLTFPESPETGNAIEVNISFEQIRVVKLLTSVVPEVASKGLEAQLAGDSKKGGNANGGASGDTQEDVGADAVRRDSSIIIGIAEGSESVADPAFDFIRGFF